MTQPVITVTIGERQVLRLEGDTARALVVCFEDQTRVASALGRAIGLFLAVQPQLGGLATAVDAIERMADLPEPGPAHAAVAEIVGAVAEFSRHAEADAAAGAPASRTAH